MSVNGSLAGPLMEDLLAPEMESNCSVCGELDVRGLAGDSGSELIHQCQMFGHLRYADGSAVSGEGIRFLTEAELKKFGLRS